MNTKPILNYFLFDGTGSRDSLFPSNGIILFDDPLKSKNWKLLNKDNAIDFLWRKLVFSIRSKGMPNGYPYEMSKKTLLNKSIIDKWTEHMNEKYKGALHIRIS